MKKQFYGECENCNEEFFDEDKIKYVYKNNWREVRCRKCGELLCKSNKPYYDRLNKNFEVKGICRADLIENIGEEKAMTIGNEEMKSLASLMSDYLQEDYWESLKLALETLNME